MEIEVIKKFTTPIKLWTQLVKANEFILEILVILYK